MAQKYVGRCFVRISQKGVQLLRELRKRSRHRTGITPAISGSVIGANTSETRYFGLYKSPPQRGYSESGHKDDSRASIASAIDIEIVTANFNRLSNLVEPACVCPGLNSLI